ncbi:protein neprosin-like [Cicer arietinum]|uniref:Uncharacterized protein LOC101510006 n=1 Tax=Cicer arietinum TaxID=3827 RepID=A0A3Q7XM98_CICAR|nr:uncharacterized protein LOC101510006 [Cicer arietinum]
MISSTNATFGLAKDQCPIETVPIKRTTKEDLIRGKSFFNNLIFDGNPNSHVASISLRTVNPTYFSYFGVSGTNSIYNVKVENDQSSSSVMWVRNGAIDNTNFIGIGWHVSPELYGDDETHLYALWTSDNFKNTGCYNLLCSGFVQTSKSYYLGAPFAKTSIYGGEMFEIAISIIQDPITKDWWVTSENENLGYFPASLFSNMTSADQVGWGGRATTTSGAPGPPMGSGYFPDDIFDHASYFRYITYQNNSRKNFSPDKFLIQRFTDKPQCYNAKFYANQGKEIGPAALQFGGPGGNCDG